MRSSREDARRDSKLLNVQSSYLDAENNFIVKMLLDRSKEETCAAGIMKDKTNSPYQLEEIMLKYSNPTTPNNNIQYPSYIDSIIENTKRSNDLKNRPWRQNIRQRYPTNYYQPTISSNQSRDLKYNRTGGNDYQQPNKLVRLLERYYDWVAEIRKHRSMLERDLPTDMRCHVEKLYLIARDEIQSLRNVLSKFGVELDNIPYVSTQIDPTKDNDYSKCNHLTSTPYGFNSSPTLSRQEPNLSPHTHVINGNLGSYPYVSNTNSLDDLYHNTRTSKPSSTFSSNHKYMLSDSSKSNQYIKPETASSYYCDNYSTNSYSSSNSAHQHTPPSSSYKNSTYLGSKHSNTRKPNENKKKVLLAALRKQEVYWTSVRDKCQKELYNKLLNEEEKEVLEQKNYDATQNLISIKSNIRQLHGLKNGESVTTKLHDLLSNIPLDEPFLYETENSHLNATSKTFPGNDNTGFNRLNGDHLQGEKSNNIIKQHKSTMTSQDKYTMTEDNNSDQLSKIHHNCNGEPKKQPTSKDSYSNRQNASDSKNTMFPTDSNVDSVDGISDVNTKTYQTRIITPTRSKIDFHTISCYYQEVKTLSTDSDTKSNKSSEEGTPRLDALLERIGPVNVIANKEEESPESNKPLKAQESSKMFFLDDSLNLESHDSSFESLSFNLSDISDNGDKSQKADSNALDEVQVDDDEAFCEVNTSSDTNTINNEFDGANKKEIDLKQLSLEDDNHDEFKLDSYITWTVPKAPHIDTLTKSKPIQNSYTFNNGIIDFATAAVIDNGSGMIKAGMADEETPSVVMPNIVGKPNYTAVMSPGGKKSNYVGHQALRHKGVLKLEYPLHHGIVENWNDMEKVWDELFNNELRIDPSEHPVLMTEAPLNPLKNREHMVEIMMERYQVPAFYVAIQATLALYGSGRLTGVVLDSGDGVTHIVPVYEGYSLPFATQRINLGGHDITEYLMRIITERGYTLKTTSEREICREIKEKLCFVAEDYSTLLSEADSDLSLEKTFTLPDGNTIVIGTERFRAPELLFQPSVLGKDEGGIHERLFASVQKCDIDIRSIMYRNIILSGGTTMLEGIETRLQQELENLLHNRSDDTIKIYADFNRKTMVWRGGAALAQLSTFVNMCISNEEYYESGPQIVHKKCF